jgi:hypothetical protein
MRYRAIFSYSDTNEKFVDWLSSHLKSSANQSEIDIKQTNHATTISFKMNDQCYEYSVYKVPPEPNKLCVYVHPKLKFSSAIMGKEDLVRQAATELVHKILSSSSQVSDLGWYFEKQLWKGSSPAP